MGNARTIGGTSSHCRAGQVVCLVGLRGFRLADAKKFAGRPQHRQSIRNRKAKESVRVQALKPYSHVFNEIAVVAILCDSTLEGCRSIGRRHKTAGSYLHNETASHAHQLLSLRPLASFAGHVGQVKQCYSRSYATLSWGLLRSLPDASLDHLWLSRIRSYALFG